MYEGGGMNPNLNGQLYLEGSQDYNHHNSASLEVDDANVPLNSNEEDMIAMHAQQMAMNPGHIQEYENLRENNEMEQERMRNHVFVSNYNLEATQQQYQNQQQAVHTQHLHHQGQMHDHIMHYHNQQMLGQQQHIQYEQGHNINPHLLVNDLAQSQHAMHHQQQQQQQHQQIQHQLQQQLNAQMRAHEDQHASSAPPRKKTKTQYPWLETQGPACYSERQEQGNVDLTNISKKYKSMRCLYCFKYNPVTPWATMRPRKYEMSSLQDHANSLHHQKAEYARDKALAVTSNSAPPPLFQPVEEQGQGQQPGQQQQAGVPSASGSALPSVGSPSSPVDLSNGPITQQRSQGQGQQGQHGLSQAQGQGQQLAVPSMNNNPVNVSNNNPISHPTTTASATVSALVSKSAGKKKRSVMEMTKTHATRGTLRPPWLQTEGGLIFSERQLTDPDRPASLVRKYQNMLCTACAQHSPRSPWATMKPRKFEARLLAEHELSTHHQKTLTMGATFPLPILQVQAQAQTQASNQGAQGQSQAQQQSAQPSQQAAQVQQIPAVVPALTPVEPYHRQPQLPQHNHSQQSVQHPSHHTLSAHQQAQLAAHTLHQQQQQHIAAQQAVQQAALAAQYAPMSHPLSHSLPPQYQQQHQAMQHGHHHALASNGMLMHMNNMHEYVHQQGYAVPISAHEAAYNSANMHPHAHAHLLAQSQLHYQQEETDQRFANNSMMYQDAGGNIVYYDPHTGLPSTFAPNETNNNT